MSGAYVSADDLDEIRDALRVGVSLVVVAVKLRVPPRELAAALGVQRKPARWPEPVADEVDLWAGLDRLEATL
jgi:hypothetical protein